MNKDKIIDLSRLSEFKEKILSLIPTKISQLNNDSEYVNKTDIEELKKSVSNGKELVAGAITEKGVTTAADAAFATMADNIGQIETGSEIKLQESKTISPSTSKQTVFPDDEYDGLEKVIVNAVQTQEKTVSPSKDDTWIYLPDDGKFFSKVTVNKFNLKLQSKTVTPSTTTQTVKPDDGYHGLSQVTVNVIQLEIREVNPTNTPQIIIPNTGFNGFSKVVVNAIQTQEKAVNPSTAAQTITPDSGKYLSKVTVNAAKLQSKTVTPSASIQTVKPDSGYIGLSSVSVAAASMLDALPIYAQYGTSTYVDVSDLSKIYATKKPTGTQGYTTKLNPDPNVANGDSIGTGTNILSSWIASGDSTYPYVLDVSSYKLIKLLNNSSGSLIKTAFYKGGK